ncbi:MAG: D-glycerate dehydrogenase [Thermoplasmata archaeon]
MTRKIPEKGLNKITERYKTRVNPESRRLTKDEIIAGILGKKAVLCTLTDIIDRDIIQAGDDLKVISNYAVGYDNIDIECATENGIAVTNTPGVLTDATAELAFALMLAVARNIVKGDRFVRQDKFQGWDPTLMIGSELKGKTLGVVGMGNIGSALAKRAAGFHMEIIYYNRSRVREIEDSLGAEFMKMNELLQSSDFVSLHVPLTEETHGMIGKEELEMMKDSAYLINTARGEVVNEEEVIDALRCENIAGAGVDVFADEPYGANPNYYDLDNVVLAPHLGSASVRARDGMAVMAADNLIAVLEGKMPENIVNPEVLG